MAVKTLTIMEDIYSDLVKAKKEDESFSQLFRRLLKENRTSVDEFFGVLSDLDEKDMKKVKVGMEEFKKSADKSFNRRLRELKL